VRQKHGLTGSSNASVSPQNDNNLVGNMRNYGMRSGGLSRRGLRGSFVPPIRSNGGNAGNMTTSRVSGKCDDSLEDSTRRWLVSLAFIIFIINLICRMLQFNLPVSSALSIPNLFSISC